MATKVKTPLDDKIYYVVTNIVLGLIMLIVLMPLINVIANSFSSPSAVVAGRVKFWPVEFSVRGYEAVFEYDSVLTGYRNSFIYMIVGTVINLVMTMLAAYPLANPKLPYRNAFMMMFTFTMFFGGGMIPNYLLLRDLRMLNTIWAMVIPGAISVYNMIIVRTFIQSNIPLELSEAAELDGCNEFLYLTKIVLPLSKAVIAVIALYYAVAHWNSYFNAFLYLNDPDKKPLQLVLREILVLNSINQEQLLMAEENQAQIGMAELLKYSVIIVASLPVIIMYPFVQRYFVKGVMIGSVKG
ncbi:MAG: carbohydrate ABC transporter permease [Candidatus Fimadaptatus sp.]|jgi:putative aldouronate transport system permease protein